MRISRQTLWLRLTAAFLLVAVVGVAVVAVVANRATTAGLRALLIESEWAALRNALAEFYAAQGDWSGVERVLTAGRPGQGGAGLLLVDAAGKAVAAAGGRANRPSGPQDAEQALPIVVDGRTVGSLLINYPGGSAGGYGAALLAQVNRALWLGGSLSVALALTLGALLARGLTRPLDRLIQATRQAAAGDLTQHVPPGPGELGELAASFNQMIGALAAAEEQRRQLVADVAHELRTPLSIMRGHVEAMLDGVYPLSADNLAVVHEETLLLGRLVEDLRTLSLAESGHLPLRLRPTDLSQLLRQTALAFEPQAEAEGVRLELDAPAELPPVMADPDRLQQVLNNLAANALRSLQVDIGRTPTLRLVARSTGAHVQVQVVDNGPGLSAEAQAHAFDRFWRADGAERDRSGSGLGLAICRGIVLAHGGRIWAAETPGGGATFVVELPSTA